MAIMAVLADGRVEPTLSAGQSMHAGAITLRLAAVAFGTVHRFGRDIIIRMAGGNVRMTTGASVGSMTGSRQFGGIDKEGNDFSGGVGGGQRFVGMTIEASAVFDFVGRGRRKPGK